MNELSISYWQMKNEHVVGMRITSPYRIIPSVTRRFCLSVSPNTVRLDSPLCLHYRCPEWLLTFPFPLFPCNQFPFPLIPIPKFQTYSHDNAIPMGCSRSLPPHSHTAYWTDVCYWFDINFFDKVCSITPHRMCCIRCVLLLQTE